DVADVRSARRIAGAGRPVLSTPAAQLRPLGAHTPPRRLTARVYEPAGRGLGQTRWTRTRDVDGSPALRRVLGGKDLPRLPVGVGEDNRCSGPGVPPGSRQERTGEQMI